MTWRDLHVSPDATHHNRDGIAAYTARFDAVLKFHAPGLAPVRRGDQAWHIDEYGDAAYARRFLRTFGFYEGGAAVVSPEGWHHVSPTGDDLYAERYAWCGNFQEGRCPVRDGASAYLHINARGEPIGGRWRYAGDFRDDVAVVQRADGRSTHVNRDGEVIHERWYEDLDVFHKGLARARDLRGWTHVDAHGAPVYARRFVMVEPFYNGQARVERFDGCLEIITPDGETLVELRAPRHDEFAALSGDLVGYWRTQTLATAVSLGVFDALPSSLAELSSRCGLSDEHALRLLRALEELRVVERDGAAWRCTPRGAFLTTEHPWSLAGAAAEYAGRLGACWSNLVDALTKSPRWSPPTVFEDVARSADIDRHHAMLRSYARHDYERVPVALALRGDEHLIDAGGGLGTLASGVLRLHPHARVTLLDRPEVTALAEVPPDARSRFSACAADLFETWPVSGDAVLLARVLHDWPDAEAARLLGRARAALPRRGRLYVVEMLLPDEGGDGGLCDLHLLVATGGRERTVEDFAGLFRNAGFALVEVRRLAALPSILVAEAV
jgi:hypothetical protein